jgi:CheY-like chemotaxis protein
MKGLTVLLAEDNEDDAHLVELAMKRAEIRQPLQVVADGVEAIDYLCGKGQYEDRKHFPFPRVLITDLKMPRMNGFEVLEWLKNHPECSVIPTVVFSASAQEADIDRAYRLGASAYFRKPATLSELCELLQVIFNFWSTCLKPIMPERC